MKPFTNQGVTVNWSLAHEHSERKQSQRICKNVLKIQVHLHCYPGQPSLSHQWNKYVDTCTY